MGILMHDTHTPIAVATFTPLLTLKHWFRVQTLNGYERYLHKSVEEI